LDRSHSQQKIGKELSYALVWLGLAALVWRASNNASLYYGSNVAWMVTLAGVLCLLIGATLVYNVGRAVFAGVSPYLNRSRVVALLVFALPLVMSVAIAPRAFGADTVRSTGGISIAGMDGKPARNASQSRPPTGVALAILSPTTPPATATPPLATATTLLDTVTPFPGTATTLPATDTVAATMDTPLATSTTAATSTPLPTTTAPAGGSAAAATATTTSTSGPGSKGSATSKAGEKVSPTATGLAIANATASKQPATASSSTPPASSTPLPATATSQPPTATRLPATATSLPPTATAIPPTPTQPVALLPDTSSANIWTPDLNELSYAIDNGDVGGRQFRVLGFVYRKYGLPGSSFILTRYVTPHCSAEAHALGVLLQNSKADSYADDQWLWVTGTVDRITIEGKEVPVIKATSIQPATEPDVPYIIY